MITQYAYKVCIHKNGLKQYDKLTPSSGIESIQGGKDSNGLSAN